MHPKVRTSQHQIITCLVFLKRKASDGTIVPVTETWHNFKHQWFHKRYSDFYWAGLRARRRRRLSESMETTLENYHLSSDTALNFCEIFTVQITNITTYKIKTLLSA
jgi:hypothetical protein